MLIFYQPKERRQETAPQWSGLNRPALKKEAVKVHGSPCRHVSYDELMEPCENGGSVFPKVPDRKEVAAWKWKKRKNVRFVNS